MPCHSDSIGIVYGYNVEGESLSHKYYVDFICCMEYLPQHQVVYVHDPVCCNNGFYYCRYVGQGNLHLIECDHSPIMVNSSGQFFVKFVSISHEVEDIHISPKLAYQDYMKELQTRSKFNLDYTEYMECVIDELIIRSGFTKNNACDSNMTRHTPRLSEHILVPKSDSDSVTDPINHIHDYVTEDAYIPSQRIGFLSHQKEEFEFVGPDRQPVTIQTVEQCIHWANVIA